MRTVLNNSFVTITASPDFHFIGDRFIYRFNAKSGDSIKIVATVNSSEVYTATSFGRFLQMDLSDVIRKLGKGRVGIQLSYSIAGGSSGVVGDAITVAEGKSVLYRTHGSTTIIETSAPNSNVQIYVVAPCTISNGKQFIGASKNGIYNINDRNGEIGVIYEKAQTIGDLYDSKNGVEFKIKVVQKCVPSNGVTVSYIDTDGCARIAAGVIMSDTLNVKAIEYNENTDEIENRVNRKIAGGDKLLRVGFDHIKKGQHIEDIALCERVRIVSASRLISFDCIPTTSQIVNNIDNSQNYFVNFKIMEL